MTDQVRRRSAPASSKQDRRPTPDQLYLADRLNGGPDVWRNIDGESARAMSITIPAIQKWNTVYGVTRTTEALRTAWGFPPLGGIENPYAYVQGILRGTA